LTAEQTGQPLEKILKDNDHDHWFTAAEALDYGFIDHVVETASLAGGGGMSGASSQATGAHMATEQN
jgi:ATP-dependent Clp protease protease subunit